MDLQDLYPTTVYKLFQTGKKNPVCKTAHIYSGREIHNNKLPRLLSVSFLGGGGGRFAPGEVGNRGPLVLRCRSDLGKGPDNPGHPPPHFQTLHSFANIHT